MGRFLALTIALAGSGAGGEVSAQGDSMELQRCIWRCLAGRGADDPAYHACVEAQCSGMAEDGTSSPATAQYGAWTLDPLGADGKSAFASGSGIRVAYNCRRDGTSFVYLDGAAVPRQSGRLDLVVGGRAYPLRVDPGGAGVMAPVPGGAPVLDALRSGSRAELRAGARTLGELPLSGSSQAVGAALAYCRG